MRIVFTDSAWNDYPLVSGARAELVKRINQLKKETSRSPFEGIGKPEPLKGELAGCWSRRITDEHRLVYLVKGTDLTIIACRYHYQ